VSFTDTQNHWAKDVIEKYASQGLISTETGEFRPDDPVTLAEFVTIINKFFKVTAPTDVSGEWYETQLGAAQGRGYVDVLYGRLDPDQPVTHLQYNLMAYDLLGKPEWNNVGVLSAYSGELDSISGNVQHSKSVAFMVANSLNSEFSDGRLHLDDYLTRAELISNLNKIDKRSVALSIVIGPSTAPRASVGSDAFTRSAPASITPVATPARQWSPSSRSRFTGEGFTRGSDDESSIPLPAVPGNRYGMDRSGKLPRRNRPSTGSDSTESTQPRDDTAATESQSPATFPADYDAGTGNASSSEEVNLPDNGLQVLPPRPSAEPNGVNDFYFDLKTNTWEPIK
jgi:hypothetical protein